MPGDDSRIPVTVLTGFLGSGKTTLLNHILSSKEHGLRFAIIENEFGEVGVDEKLIVGKADAEEELVEVMNGCICCTVRGDLVTALKRMHEKVKKFDAVLIETTGMADPAPVAQTFFVDDDIAQMYRLDGIVTMVDAAHIIQHLDEEKPEGAENESVEQLAFADRIILNKLDLVGRSAETAAAGDECKDVDDGEDAAGAEDAGNKDDGVKEDSIKDDAREEALSKLEKRIRTINPTAPIIRAEYSQVDPNKLLKLSAFDLQKVVDMDPEFLNASPNDHVHDESVSSVAWSFPGLELNINKLERWISVIMREMGTELFRYKGVLAVKGCEEKYVFQGVHMLYSGDFASDAVAKGRGKGRKKKKTQGESSSARWQPGEQRECRFVFIGKNIKQKHAETLKAGFLDCKAEENLRFAVGDIVEARGAEGWKKAKVLKTWDAGNPYRLEVQNKEKTNIWGPLDLDLLVRPVKS